MSSWEKLCHKDESFALTPHEQCTDEAKAACSKCPAVTVTAAIKCPKSCNACVEDVEVKGAGQHKPALFWTWAPDTHARHRLTCSLYRALTNRRKQANAVSTQLEDASQRRSNKALGPKLHASTLPMLFNCPWGLANRMRSLATLVHLLAHGTVPSSRELTVAWGPGRLLGPCLNRSFPYCAWAELFEPIDAQLLNLTSVDMLPFEQPDHVRSILSRPHRYHQVSLTCDAATKYVEQGELASTYSRLFVPTPALKQHADSFVEEHGLRRCVGMHMHSNDRTLNRGANFRAKVARSFERRIRQEIEGHGQSEDGSSDDGSADGSGDGSKLATYEEVPPPCFLLIADDPWILRHFQRLFDGIGEEYATLVMPRAVSSGVLNPMLDRDDERGISARDTVVEAYLLAHCRLIWGTIGSPFSQMAATWLPRDGRTFERLPTKAEMDAFSGPRKFEATKSPADDEKEDSFWTWRLSRISGGVGLFGAWAAFRCGIFRRTSTSPRS